LVAIARHQFAAYDRIMVVNLILFAAGVFVWTFVEYAVHGWMSHRFVTFVTQLHQVHHRDASAVFAVGAWIPVAAIIGILPMVFGMTPAMYSVCGLMAGFAAYEALHYRLHFTHPATRWEEGLRTRHLAHHFAFPDRCLGVTTSLWDRIFGTEPGIEEFGAIEGDLSRIAPIATSCNLRRAINHPLTLFSGSVSLPCKGK
jgi:sterol desaturase/sphingolipid hydroxylase (fatty acid hydroxylase superfamily)